MKELIQIIRRDLHKRALFAEGNTSLQAGNKSQTSEIPPLGSDNDTAQSQVPAPQPPIPKPADKLEQKETIDPSWTLKGQSGSFGTFQDRTGKYYSRDLRGWTPSSPSNVSEGYGGQFTPIPGKSVSPTSIAPQPALTPNPTPTQAPSSAPASKVPSYGEMSAQMSPLTSPYSMYSREGYDQKNDIGEISPIVLDAMLQSRMSGQDAMQKIMMIRQIAETDPVKAQQLWQEHFGGPAEYKRNLSVAPNAMADLYTMNQNR